MIDPGLHLGCFSELIFLKEIFEDFCDFFKSQKNILASSTSSLSDLVDSGDHQPDARFPSSLVDHHAKQRFEKNVTKKRSKLRQISKTNTKLVRNNQAIKEDINRRLDWQAWLILANSDVQVG